MSQTNNLNNMKSINKIISIAFVGLCLVSFTSCDKISNVFDRNREETNNVNDLMTQNSNNANDDAAEQARMDSINKAKQDSVNRAAETERKTQELSDKLTEQESSLSDISNKVNKMEKDLDGMMDKSSAYTFMVVEFIMFLLIIWYLYEKQSKRIKKMRGKLHNLEESEGGMSEIQVNRRIQMAINDLAKQINNKNKSQDDRMDDIVKRLIKLEGPNDAYSQYAQTSFQQPQPEAPKKEDSKKSDTFYMPRTRMNLQFDDSKKKYVKDETTYFKFVVKKGNKAEFTFDPQENNIVGAYDDRENSLVTVCDVESKSPTPSRYNNITPGEAELSNGTWHVTRKLKLEYV